jgi:hypothetical protein
MSTKFKKGDLVELLPTSFGVNHCDGLQSGMIGTVIDYGGKQVYPKLEKWVDNSWRVEFSHNNKRYFINEIYLKLVPGNPDCKDVGKWDDCPWSPYKVTEPKVLDKVIEGEEA